MAAAQEALRRCLLDARLPDKFVEYCTDTVKLESMEDFVNLVTIANYETELKDVLCEQCAETRGNPLMLSCARAAWRSARTQILRQEHRRSQGAEDLDSPLDPSTQETLMGQFSARYSVAPDVHRVPSDALLGKLYREVQRGSPTVISVSKVKSLHWASGPSQDRTITLAGQVKLQLDKDEPVPVKFLVDYYKGLRILAYGYAIVGSHKVKSMTAPGFAPLGVVQGYADTVLRIASNLELGSGALLDFVRARDAAHGRAWSGFVAKAGPLAKRSQRRWLSTR